MEIIDLIKNAPSGDNIEKFSDWIHMIEATLNTAEIDDEMKENINNAKRFLLYESRRQEYKALILSKLKILLKDRGDDMESNDKNKIFIVHGHDDNLRLEVENLLHKANLIPIVLQDEANKGQTIIEKLEEKANKVKYCIVLYSEDKENNNTIARPNVIFEFGFFVAKLGRKNLCVIKDGDVNLPGDTDGIIYIEKQNEWKSKLAKELRNNGFNIDLNNI